MHTNFILEVNSLLEGMLAGNRELLLILVAKTKGHFGYKVVDGRVILWT
jgi:hypothetical protein